MSKSIKPRLAKGTRDFSPTDMRLRNYLINTIREHFEGFGFEQIETPAVENLETLTGKYGNEGDKLIFKILNSGDYLKGADAKNLEERNSDKLIPEISEKALRYDLTVPFARYVVMHQNEITFPFRRYQIQPVWRADRPQKGRYREFFQCDADVIGSNSLLIECEFLMLIDKVFKSLDIKADIRLNSRKILYGFCEQNKIADKFTSFTTILDKLDKKSWEDLSKEFIENGFGQEIVDKTKKLASFSGGEFNKTTISKIKEMVSNSETGLTGVDELLTMAEQMEIVKPEYVGVKVDLTLARGLDYYTGAIIEVVATEHEIGSVCGGGRYDDLTGIFGLRDVSGIGISFGIDRLFDILKESKNLNVDNDSVLIINFGEHLLNYNLKLLYDLREVGIKTELYPESDKLKKQFKYADQKQFKFVIVTGEEEVKNNEVSLKVLKSGEQRSVSRGEIVRELKNKLT